MDDKNNLETSLKNLEDEDKQEVSEINELKRKRQNEDELENIPMSESEKKYR